MTKKKKAAKTHDAGHYFVETVEKLMEDFQSISDNEAHAEGYHDALLYLFVDIHTKCMKKPVTVGEMRACLLEQANATLDSIIDIECCDGKGGDIDDHLVVDDTELN